MLAAAFMEIRGVTIVRSISLAAALVLFAVPTMVHAACATPEEVRAAQVRQLHDELQVTALNCRGDDPSLPGKWSSYVGRHGGTMAENAKVMHAYFARTGKGAAGFDRYNTSMTNQESIRVHETPGYCESHAAILDRTLDANGHQLALLAAETVGKPSGIIACADETREAKIDRKKSKTEKKTARAD